MSIHHLKLAKIAPASYFTPDAPEDGNVKVIVAGLDRRNLPNETEVWMRGVSAVGRIDIVAQFEDKLYGWEVKRYTMGAKLIADGIAQAADYARAEIASGTWQGRKLDFVFVGPTPNRSVSEFGYVPAEMLSRYTAPLGVGVFDQQMGVYAFGQPAIRFLPTSFEFYAHFDRVKKHTNDFRR